jgi:hypothetical protein
LIIEVTPEKPVQGKLPDWDLIHKISRDRLCFRRALIGIKNSVSLYSSKDHAEATGAVYQIASGFYKF